MRFLLTRIHINTFLSELDLAKQALHVFEAETNKALNAVNDYTKKLRDASQSVSGIDLELNRLKKDLTVAENNVAESYKFVQRAR